MATMMTSESILGDERLQVPWSLETPIVENVDVITLQTPFNQTGHTEDTILSPQQEEDDEEESRSLPLALFRQCKMVSIPTSAITSKAAFLLGKTCFDFPSNRLLEGFERALLKTVCPETSISVTSPDLVSVLTGALMLKCASLVNDCINAIDQEKLATAEFTRCLKVAKKFQWQHDLADALLRFALRHKEQMKPYSQNDELLRESYLRIRARFAYLFNPVLVSLTQTENRQGAEPPVLSYPNLECHRIERLELFNEERVFRLLREGSTEIICWAKLNKLKDGFWFFTGSPSTDEDFIAATKYDRHYCALVESNVLGDGWTLYDFGNKENRTPHGRIMYAKNPLGRVPNAMSLVLPSNTVALETKKPRWSDRLGWSLDFKMRASVASKKNFLLLDKSNPEEKIVMLFGKKHKHVFSLDICSPLSPILAMAVALTTFADKLIVT